MKICSYCRKELELSEFYLFVNKNRYNSRCKSCQRLYDRKQNEKEKMENCGGFQVKQFPNQYLNDIQKNCVFEVMTKLGFIFNEKNSIWWKPGLKDENGVFINLKKYIKPRKSIVTEEMARKMFEMRENGHTYAIIARKMKISSTTVGCVLKKWKI